VRSKLAPGPGLCTKELSHYCLCCPWLVLLKLSPWACFVLLELSHYCFCCTWLVRSAFTLARAAPGCTSSCRTSLTSWVMPALRQRLPCLQPCCLSPQQGCVPAAPMPVHARGSPLFAAARWPVVAHTEADPHMHLCVPTQPYPPSERVFYTQQCSMSHKPQLSLRSAAHGAEDALSVSAVGA